MANEEHGLGKSYFTQQVGKLSIEPGKASALDLQDAMPTGGVFGFSLEFIPEISSDKDIVVEFDTARKPRDKILRVHITNLCQETIQVEIWQMPKSK